MSAPAILESAPQIYWYGERGVINAVINHITRTGDTTSGIRSMLKAVAWANGKSPEWLNQITAVSIVVEVGLADFGDPDVLLVCRIPGRTKLVFAEAKVVSYTDSMQSTSRSIGARWGMAQQGFNSSINGQLTLKYRFATALALWDGHAPVITESPEMFAAYRQALNDSPAKSPGRTLAKAAILSRIFKPLGLVGIAEEDCYYVALTWDSADKMFFGCPEVPSDCLPKFLNDSGENVFPKVAARLGWLGYRELRCALGLDDCPEYVAAFRTMLDSEEPPASYYVEMKKGRWAAFPDNIVALASDIAASFSGRAQKWAGSYSLQDENKQTIAKIIPNADSVFVGLRTGLMVTALVDTWASGAKCVITRRVKNVEFRGVNVRDIEEARAFILALGARLDAPTEEQDDDTV